MRILITIVAMLALLATLPLSCELDERGNIDKSCRQRDCNHLVEGDLDSFRQCVDVCNANAIRRRRREGREHFPLWFEE